MPNAPESSRLRTARRLMLVGLLAASAAAAAAIAPVPARSAGADTRPADADRGATSAPREGAPTRPAAADGPPATDEWTRVQKFIATKSPNKWMMYENLPADGRLKAQLRQQLVQRYQALQRMEQNDPERHEMEARAIWIEDEIYGILRDLDAVMRDGQDPTRDEARLRDKVGELVQNRDRWKAKRLERVARELRSMGGGSGAGHLAQAVKHVDDEMNRLLNLEPEARRQRVENRVKEFKQKMTGTKPRPPLGRPLPGAESQPVDAPLPGVGPSVTPAGP